MVALLAWLALGYLGITSGQTFFIGLEGEIPYTPVPSPDYCLLPEPIPNTNFFSVYCYGVDNPSTECLNVPHSPVRPNWTLTYICDDGYYFPRGQGFIDSRCQGGQWVPPPPMCQDRICIPPDNPPHGWYTTHPLECTEDCRPLGSRLRDNSLLSLQCANGYSTPFEDSALCVKGIWLEPAPCQYLTSAKLSRPTSSLTGTSFCQLPDPPAHGTYFSADCYGSMSSAPECDNNPGVRVRNSWTLTFLCDDGFLPPNNQTYYHTKCTGGQWNPTLPVCTVSLLNGCKMPKDPPHGEYVVSCAQTQCATGSQLPSGYKLSLTCEEGFRPQDGYVLSTCNKGVWSPPPPTCANKGDVIQHRDISEIQSQFAGCVLPEPPRHGRYVLFSEDCHGAQPSLPWCYKQAGETVSHLQVISISCDRGYQLGGHAGSMFFVSCDDSQWSHVFPGCFKPCQQLMTRTVDLECYQGPSLVPCNGTMLPNTTVTTKCKPNHETTDDPRDLICKDNGEWSGRLPVCKPNCGLSKLNNYEIVPTIINGNASLLGYFPWHAGIFRMKDGKWKNECGGTLISPHIILTAAHCVTVDATKVHPQELQVALGKYYRDWYTYEATSVRRGIKDIQILPNYLGQESFLDLDIALMALESPVTVTSFIMPACVDYRVTQPIRFDMIGYLAGWGKTQECVGCGEGSETLLYTNTSIISFKDCFNIMQRLHRLPFSRLTTDKFCAGTGAGTVAEKGDSGGGITFVFNEVHYVMGVVSAKISVQDKYSFSSFTNVTHHATWIYKMASYFDSIVVLKK